MTHHLKNKEPVYGFIKECSLKMGRKSHFFIE